MDLFSDHSDSAESQPTQLLQYALTTATRTGAEHSEEWGLNEQREQEEDGDNVSKDFSIDSMIVPPVQTSTSRYQLSLHSSTQTQPLILHKEQEIIGEGEGSQKENTPASNENKVARTRSPSPQLSSTKLIKGSHADPLNACTASIIGQAKAAKSVSVQSLHSARTAQPHLHHTKSFPAVPNQRGSPFPSSQDSFGGAVSQDPAANYIAQATQIFQVPLSDLGHSANNFTMDDHAAHLPNSQEDEGDTWMDKIRRAYEQTKSNEAIGNVLVASTPSQSDASQNSSRNISFPHPDASQLLNDESSLDSVEARRGRYGSQANASQSSLLVAEDDPTAAIQPAALIEEFAPTQPSTPMENTLDSALVEDMYAQTFPSHSTLATSGTTSTLGRRSLLSLIHPDQRARRIRRLRGNDVARPAPSTINDARQPCESVQPSPSVAMRPSSSLTEENAVPSPIPRLPKQVSSSHLPQLPQQCARSTPSIPQRFDNLDVVPDSEPPALSDENSTMHLFRPLSPMSELDSGEIVADSMEAPESSQDPQGDVPLAVLLQVKSTAEPATGDSRSLRRSPSLPPPVVPVKKANRSTTKSKNSTRGTKNVKPETVEIPTSAPEQDLRDLDPWPERVGTPTMVPPIKKGGQKGKTPVAPTRKSVRTRRAPATGKKRAHPSDTEASDASSCRGDTRPAPKAVQEEEEEEHTDDEDHAEPVVLKATSSKKRRRIENVKSTRPVSKTSTRSKTSDTPAPTRATKRLRQMASTSRLPASHPATRVFALWKQDGHYYSGTTHSLQAGTRYLVKFDDDTDDSVDITRLRRCELRVGDAVIINQCDFHGTVVDVSQMESGSVRIEIDDGSESDYDIKDIRVAARTILSHWKDRTLTADSIVTIVRPKLLQVTPSPSKMSLTSTTSTKPKKLFAKTGFVVTLTISNKNPEQMKDTMMVAIKQNGGTVIDDWSSIFSMEGAHSHSNKRWTASQDDFKFRPKPGFEALERVFLLADDYNQKPKFLMALALGIPCLSHEWMNDNQISSDWQPHLLPAGFSEPLSARVSQLVDLDWGNCKEHLSDIMSNMVACKLFTAKTILCLGADFVPLPPRGGRKGGLDVTKEASRIVPWIIICMGASRVEVVTEVKFTSQDLSEYDYIVIKDFGERPKDLPEDGPTLVHVPWVKDCLIAGRLLPPDGL